MCIKECQLCFTAVSKKMELTSLLVLCFFFAGGLVWLMASLLVKLVKASLLVSRSQVPDVSSGKKEATFSCSTQPCFLSLTRLIVVIFCAAKHKIAAKHACSVLQSTMHASKWTFFCNEKLLDFTLVHCRISKHSCSAMGLLDDNYDYTFVCSIGPTLSRMFLLKQYWGINPALLLPTHHWGPGDFYDWLIFSVSKTCVVRLHQKQSLNTAFIDLSQPWPCTSTRCTASSTTIRVARGIESGYFWATLTLALQGNPDPVASCGVPALAGCVLKARDNGLQKMWQGWASSRSSCQTLLAALQSTCEGTTWCLTGSLAPQFPGFVFGKMVHVMSLCENLREHGYGFDLTLFFKPRPFRATTVLPGIWAHGKSLDLWSAAHRAPSSTVSGKWAGWQFILMKRMMTSWPCNGKWCEWNMENVDCHWLESMIAKNWPDGPIFYNPTIVG